MVRLNFSKKSKKRSIYLYSGSEKYSDTCRHLSRTFETFENFINIVTTGNYHDHIDKISNDSEYV